MKKIFLISTLLIISAIFISCSKTPFKAQETLESKALVYIYVKTPEGLNDSSRYPKYSIKVDGKYLDGDIGHEEYTSLYLDPSNVTISASRATVEIQNLKLDLKPANTYYLRIKSFSDDFAEFNFVELPKSIAFEEIIVTKNVTPKEEKKIQVLQTLSMPDEIEKAYELKEKGILTQKEFEKMKADILNANR